MRLSRSSFLVAVSCILACAPEPGVQKIRIESADQLPRHTYRVDGPAVQLLEDSAAFGRLASALRADLETDLATYEIADSATRAQYYATLSMLALIDGRHAEAIAWTDSVRTVEDKPGARALAGTFERALAAAAQAPQDRRANAFALAYRKEINALDYDEAETSLKGLKSSAEILSPSGSMGFIMARVQPAAQSGEISGELAQLVVFSRLYMVAIRPHQDTILAVLADVVSAHTVMKPDIWASRSVSLDGRSGLTPVLIGIWDTGVDASLFPGRVFVNANEIPGNGVDDDGNGFVDDVHGIAHDLQLRRSTGDLKAIDYKPEEEARLQDVYKGFSDMQAGIDSREADAYKRHVRSLTPNEFGPFLESNGIYGNYAHGTHVTGIAVAGNPAARIVIGRFTDDTRFVPDPPTIEQAEGWIGEFRDKVRYFVEHGVRVVNMSWSFSAQAFEQQLEQNNAGGNADERKQLAQRLYQMQYDVLEQEIGGASGILFVASAGNDNADNRFSGSIPAALDLPNLITVGAVDQAGDEAPFTSYGKVEIWANGFEVASLVPGGKTLRFSGTSMAAPQVTNLAAKVIAIAPEIPVPELRRLILDGADEKTVGESKRIRLMNPQRTMRMLTER
jgi:subtilisin family serine protease